jgi:hypothetical protein
MRVRRVQIRFQPTLTECPSSCSASPAAFSPSSRLPTRGAAGSSFVCRAGLPHHWLITIAQRRSLGSSGTANPLARPARPWKSRPVRVLLQFGTQGRELSIESWIGGHWHVIAMRRVRARREQQIDHLQRQVARSRRGAAPRAQPGRTPGSRRSRHPLARLPRERYPTRCSVRVRSGESATQCGSRPPRLAWPGTPARRRRSSTDSSSRNCRACTVASRRERPAPTPGRHHGGAGAAGTSAGLRSPNWPLWYG